MLLELIFNVVLRNWTDGHTTLPLLGLLVGAKKGILEDGIFIKKLNHFVGFLDQKELEWLRIERTGETSLSQTGPQQFL